MLFSCVSRFFFNVRPSFVILSITLRFFAANPLFFRCFSVFSYFVIVIYIIFCYKYIEYFVVNFSCFVVRACLNSTCTRPGSTIFGISSPDRGGKEQGDHMGLKNISYFRQNDSTRETIHILDYGYHQTTHGRHSTQKIVDHYVLHFIVSGKGTYTIHDTTYHLGLNDCFLLIPNVPLKYQSDPKEPWVYYWVGFSGSDALEFMRLCGLSYQTPTLHYEPITALTSYIQPMILPDTSNISDSYTALGTFYLLCSRLIAHGSTKPLSRKENYVYQAISLIQDSYYKDITVQNIADAVGLERTYLYRIFREIIGVSMQKYIAALRFKRACYFLESSDLSYSEIAYYSGYQSEQYFSMVFKQKAGCSPSAYRKQAKQEPPPQSL